MIRATNRIPGAPRSGGLARVLVVTAHEMMRPLIRHSLSTVESIDVAFVETAQEAIKEIQSRTPAVVFADVNLSDLDGFRLCRMLKLPLVTGSDQIPFIMIASEYHDVVAEHVARKAQAFAFLKLPEDEHLIARTVELALHRLLVTPKERQILTHKGETLIVSADDATSHSMQTTLELDGWRVERARTLDECAELWTQSMPHVVFVDMSSRLTFEFPKELANTAGIRPVIIALVKRADSDVLLNMLLNGVDDYLILPCEPSRIIAACGDAKVKHNFRSLHREFETHLDKLKAISEYLDLVITNSHEAIFTCDTEGNVKLWNNGAERVYGYSAEEIIGKNVDDHLDPPGFTRKSPNVVRLLIQRGSMTDPEVQRRRKDGEVFPVAATYTLIKDNAGEVLGFSVIERDVTPIKALENERIKSARLRAITQTAVTANDHINTPLGIILGYAQFLELKLAAADAGDKQALEVIQQQVYKIKGIMNKLKLISDPIVKNYSVEGVTMLDLSKSQVSNETAN